MYRPDGHESESIVRDLGIAGKAIARAQDCAETEQWDYAHDHMSDALAIIRAAKTLAAIMRDVDMVSPEDRAEAADLLKLERARGN